jgi:hypothetical protein
VTGRSDGVDHNTSSPRLNVFLPGDGFSQDIIVTGIDSSKNSLSPLADLLLA